MNEVINATIKDNIPYCTKCGEKLYGRTMDYGTIIHNKESYTQFIVRCKNCEVDNQYCSDVRVSGTKRYVFNKSEMKKVNEKTKEA